MKKNTKGMLTERTDETGTVMPAMKEPQCMPQYYQVVAKFQTGSNGH